VILDLARTEHRDALEWACRLEEPVDMGERVTALQAWCVRAIHQPTASAAIVRALLEGCGVECYVTPSTVHADMINISWRDRDGVVVVSRREMTRVPALLLSLLDIPADAPDRREMAMAALKEHGR
jgi:hypothetical protein